MEIKSNNVVKKFMFAAGALVGASLLATQQVHASTYTVKQGDTISKIAKKKYHSQSLSAIETIVQENHIANRDLIFVGDKLHLPKKIKKFKAVAQAPVQVNDSKSYTQAPAQPTQPVQQQQQQQSASNQQSNSTASTTTSPSSTSGNNLQSYVASRMADSTGVSASTWATIIQRESGWNATVTNSSGHYGLFQLAPGYKGNGGSVDEQIQGAIDLYKKQGLSAWSESAY